MKNEIVSCRSSCRWPCGRRGRVEVLGRGRERDDLRQAEVGYFERSDLFSFWVFLYENVLRLQVAMHNSTALHIVYRLDQVKHTEGHLSFLELVRLNVVEEFSAGHLLHDYVHYLLCLVGFTHLNYGFVRDQLDNLNFFSQEISLPFSKLRLDYLLNGYNFLRLLVLTL